MTEHVPCYLCTPPGVLRAVVRTYTTNGDRRLPAVKLACGHSMALRTEQHRGHAPERRTEG